MIVKMLNKVNESDVRVLTMIGDDYAVTISWLRHKDDPKVEKQSDRNHLKKNLAN